MSHSLLKCAECGTILMQCKCFSCNRELTTLPKENCFKCTPQPPEQGGSKRADLWAMILEKDATIAQQKAEIERLESKDRTSTELVQGAYATIEVLKADLDLTGLELTRQITAYRNREDCRIRLSGELAETKAALQQTEEQLSVMRSLYDPACDRARQLRDRLQQKEREREAYRELAIAYCCPDDRNDFCTVETDEAARRILNASTPEGA